MNDEIYVRDISSGAAKRSKANIDDAISSISAMSGNGFSAYYSCNGVNTRLFSADTFVRVQNSYLKLCRLQTQLEAYVRILEEGPNALLEIDANCKNSLTNFWERTTRDLQGMYQYAVDTVENVQNTLKEQILQWTSDTPVGPIFAFLMTSGETGYWLSIEDVHTKEDYDLYVKQMTIKAGWGLVTDVASIAGHISSFTLDLLKGDVVSAGADTWELINDVFVTGYDMAALAIMPIGLGLSKILKNDNIAIEALRQATEIEAKNDGLANVFEDNENSTTGVEKEIYKRLKESAQAVDTASDAVTLYKGLKGTVDFVSGESTFFGELGYKDATGTLKYSSVISDAKGNNVTKRVLGELEQTSNMVNHVKTTVGYVQTGIEDMLGATQGTFGKKLYENTAVGKTVKAFEKFGSDFGIEPQVSDNPTSLVGFTLSPCPIFR